MGEIFSEQKIALISAEARDPDSVPVPHHEVLGLCLSHEELRARLERAEDALQAGRAAMRRVLPQARGVLVVEDLESAIAATDAALGAAGERGQDG